MATLSLSGTQLNVGANGERYGLKVSALKNGTFVAVWTQYNIVNGNTDANIMAQLYNADGTPKSGSGPFEINTTTQGIQRSLGVTALNDGGFAIAWEDYSSGSTSNNVIRARTYDKNGIADKDADYRVAQIGVGLWKAPQLAAYGNGFIVSSIDGSNASTHIFNDKTGTPGSLHRKIAEPGMTIESHSIAAIAGTSSGSNTAGTSIVGVLEKNSTSGIINLVSYLPNTAVRNWSIPVSKEAFSVSVTALEGGRFIVTWADSDALTQSPYRVKAVIYDAAGVASQVKNLAASSSAINKPVVVALPNGGFALAFEEGGDVKARTYDGSGVQVHDTLVVHGPGDDQHSPAITAMLDGRFVVGWENVGAGAQQSIRAQIVDPRADAVRWTGTATDEQFGGTNFTIGDTLDGGAGSDTLYGMGGNDRLIGSAGGNDTFYGGAGTDTVSYLGASAGVGVYLLNRGNNTGAAAGDLFDGIEVIEGTIHRDTLEGGDGSDILKGGQGNDILNGFKGDDDFFGEDDNDLMFGGEGGADDFHGGEGTDIVSYSGGGGVEVYLSGRTPNRGAAEGDTYTEIEAIEGSQQADTLEGSTANDNFWADTGNDRLSGLGGNDKLGGAAGNDVLDGGAGIDELHGDEGDDIYIVDAEDVIVEVAGNGTDTLIANTSYVLAANADVETMYAGADAGNINLSGNGIGNILYGNKGSNRLNGGGGNDTLMLTGDRKDYTVKLNADGSVTLTDQIAGRDGTDTIYNVEIFQFGDTRLSLAGLAGGTQSSLTGDVVAENSASGTSIGSFVSSASGPLRFSLLGDADGRFTMDASGTLKVANGVKLDYEQASQHSITVRATDAFGTSADKVVTILVQDVLNERAIGSAVADIMKGGAGQDHFTSLDGNDQIDAGFGNDTLIGGAGKDVLTGGKGKDIFVFETKANKAANLDSITDFVVKDDGIWLENKVFAKLGKKGTEKKPAKLAKDFFTVGDKAKDADDYLIYNKKKGVLLYDADGSGAKKAVEIATLKKNLKMTEKDFFVI